MKRLFSSILFCLWACLSFASETPLTFKDTDGNSHTPLVIGEKKAAVLIFISRDCPTSNAFLPEINKIAEDYGNRFAFYCIQADAALSTTEAKQHAEFYKITSPVLLDPEQRLVNHVRATITPEVAVVARNGDMIYQGRINDLYKTQTSKRREPETHDLRNALQAIAESRPISNPTTQAIGCSITHVEK